MTLAGAAIADLALCESQLPGAFTGPAEIPGPVDYVFLGGAVDRGPSTRERWFADEVVKWDRRQR